MNLRPEDVRLMQAWAQRLLPAGDAQRHRIEAGLDALLQKALHPDFVLAPAELGRYWIGPARDPRCVSPTTAGTSATLAVVWFAIRHGTAHEPDRRPNALRNAIVGAASSSVVRWLRRWPDCEHLAALIKKRITVRASGDGSVVTYAPNEDPTEIVTSIG